MPFESVCVVCAYAYVHTGVHDDQTQVFASNRAASQLSHFSGLKCMSFLKEKLCSEQNDSLTPVE